MDLTNRVFVAVDFSPCSAASFRAAKRIAGFLGAPLTALHVVTPAALVAPNVLDPMGFGVPLPADQDLVAAARARWPGFVERCGGSGGAELAIEVGVPRDRILEVVRRERPRLLVVGAHREQDAYRGIGTTATACAQWAATHVMVVREGQAEPMRSIAVCVDFTETSRVALEQAVSLAAADGAALHILHVYGDPWEGAEPSEAIRRNMPDFAQRYREAVEHRLREFCAPLAHELAALRPKYHAVRAAGHGQGILDFTAARPCDLVVLGTRGKFSLRDFFWGSTAERVVREAKCSVLAVKPPTFVEFEPYEPLEDTAAARKRG